MFDSHGNAVEPKRFYAVWYGKKMVLSETEYDIGADVLLVRRKGTNDAWTRCDEISETLIWVPVNEHGDELPRDEDEQEDSNANSLNTLAGVE